VRTPLLKITLLKILDEAKNLLARVKKQRRARWRQAAKRRAARARDLARWRAATNCWPSAEDLMYVDEAGEDSRELESGKPYSVSERPAERRDPNTEGESGRVNEPRRSETGETPP
jgi:hypothetical protein